MGNTQKRNNICGVNSSKVWIINLFSHSYSLLKSNILCIFLSVFLCVSGFLSTEDSADSSRTLPYQKQQEELAFSIDYDDNNYGAESSGESY